MSDQLLTVHILVADRKIGLSTPPEEEIYLREAGKLIQERIRYYRELGFRDNQEVLSRIALDGVVARLKGDEQMQRLQKMVYDKIAQLNQAAAVVLP
jgi:cell division protein ZapA